MNYLFDSNKLLWHMDRVHEHFRDGKRIYPIHIDIGATKMCNARCIYCFGIFQEMTNEVIPQDTLISLFRDAGDIGIKSITVTGDGEPTLNPAIYEAVVVGRMHGLDIGFATNGISLNSDEIGTLLRTCTWLRFNLSAVGEDGYKSIHGVPQWKRVQANIKTAVSIKKSHGYDCTIGLQMVLMPSCFSHLIPEAQFAIDNHLDYMVIKQFSDPGDNKMSRFDLNWYDSYTVITELRKVEQMSTTKTQIVPKWNRIGSKGKRPYDRCVDCALIFQISGNSKCYPCGFLFNNPEFCYGDLKSQSLKEILDSKRYWDIIKRMRYDFDVHKECEGCCRHDSTNEFVWNYLHPPSHINFI